jgi:NADH-quinone oxidoreductase subunit A
MTTFFTASFNGLVLMSFLSAGFLVFMLTAAVFLGPRKRTKTKQIPFECGSVPVGDASKQRFNIGFYQIAMLFILFDVEVVFLYPWAVALRSIGTSGFFSMLLFIVILSIGLIYIWGKGLFDWNEL